MKKKLMFKSISMYFMLGILCILILSGFNSIVLITPLVLISILILIVYLSYEYNFKPDAFRLELKREKTIYNIVDYLHIIVTAVFILQIIFLFIFFPANVTQTSMNPSLYEGQKIIVVHDKKHLKRFDIIIFKLDYSKQVNVSPRENNDLWIKRLIGLPGDRLAYVDGILYVNDEAINEAYLYDENNNFNQGIYYDKNGSPKAYNSYTEDISITKILELMGLEGDAIPEGYYLLLGDNRGYSKDSRQIGLVHESQIIGKGFYLIKNIINWERIGS